MRRQFAVSVAVIATLIALPRDGHAQKQQRDLITRAEVLASAHAAGDAYSAIRSLRPHFFQQPRTVKNQWSGAESFPLAIYVGRSKQSGIEMLQQLMAERILEARYYDPSRAQNEFGKTANSGAVVVTLVDEKRDTAQVKPPL